MSTQLHSYAVSTKDLDPAEDSNQHGHWARRILSILQKAEDCQPTFEQLAKIFHVSSRTLNRHLQKEGTSFRRLSLHVRSQRAQVLLAQSAISISDLAYTLGYTDVANFSRAFKKAVGVCPSIYRDAGV